jgi:hypothetical protein
MNRPLLPVLAAALVAASFSVARAEESRSRMVFQPGQKTPEGMEPARPGAASPSSAATTTIDPEIAKRLDGFFGHLMNKETKPAYDLLAKDSLIGERAEDMTALREKTEQAYALFGAVEGYEIVAVKRVGTRLVGITALSLGERFPLRWMFSFYRGKGGWKLIDIQVDDRVAALFGDRKAGPDEEGDAGTERWPR